MQKITSLGLALVSILSTGASLAGAMALADEPNPKPPETSAPDAKNPRSQPSQGIIAPDAKSPIAGFSCSSRGSRNGKFTFFGNGRYTTSAGNGKYQRGTNSFGILYRMQSGSFAGSSIVRQNGQIYLVATKDENRAAQLAQVDGAAVCTGGEIMY